MNALLGHCKPKDSSGCLVVAISTKSDQSWQDEGKMWDLCETGLLIFKADNLKSLLTIGSL